MSNNQRPIVTEVCTVVPVGEERVAYKCGHQGPTAAILNLYGQEYDCRPSSLAGREKCPECLNAEALKEVIRCCQCGFPILPGSGVVRYGDVRKFRKEWTTVDGGGAVGCMRVTCCENPLGVSGNWNGTKVESVFGGMVMDDDDGGSYGGFGD